MLTVGSLFAGIGGFDLGLERAGMRSVWQCEIDPYAIRVLEKHWPDVLRVRDVRDVGAGTVPYVDVICGGFPCQDISLAGRGAGLAGERSGLWFEYARVIGELRPRYVIVENVRALIVRGLDTILGTLAEIGYDAEWDCIPASAVGAPHRRDRVWLVAYPAHTEPQEHEGHAVELGERAANGRREQLVAGARAGCGDGRWAHSPRARGCGPERSAAGDQGDVADAAGEGLEGAWLRGRSAFGGPATVGDTDLGERDARRWELGAPGRREPRDAGWWSVEPDVARVAHGIPARVDRVRALGNALVPQIAEWIGRRILEHEGGVT